MPINIKNPCALLDLAIKHITTLAHIMNLWTKPIRLIHRSPNTAKFPSFELNVYLLQGWMIGDCNRRQWQPFPFGSIKLDLCHLFSKLLGRFAFLYLADKGLLRNFRLGIKWVYPSYITMHDITRGYKCMM